MSAGLFRCRLSGLAAKYAALPRETPHAPLPDDERTPADVRRRARRLGAVLWLVVVAIVASLFAWKLSHLR